MAISDDPVQAALDYHQYPRPGKIATAITKPADTQRDLTLAYSPGVAEPVRAIMKDPDSVYDYTNKGNLVAVISNGTAILGLGNQGPMASKPVMEGKGVLFKKFADIDVFDIEVQCNTAASFIDTVAAIAPTFGGINLEDIKAPECFQIESTLKEMLDIPIFHDDQHGTAIIVGAALLNALEIQGKKLEDVKVVCLGAGAAGLATMHLLARMGVPRRNIYIIDRQGVIHIDRESLGPYKFAFAQRTDQRTLQDALKGADVFVGVSGPNLLSADDLKLMNDKPIIFALSNPDPEIKPEIAKSVRPDCIIATGRSDYPNQVNNVLCFPYLFRGALDVRAKAISTPMYIEAVKVIASLAKQPVPPEVLQGYPNEGPLEFGPEYIIPKPTDPRLREYVAPAIAQAAVDAGLARRPIPKNYKG